MTTPDCPRTFDEELGIDPLALRTRYRGERDKRLRTDAAEQFVETRGEHARFNDDPHADPGFARAPLTDEVEIAVIGGGFGGLLLGAHLRKAGVEAIRFIERGGDFGGTWYWNRYPGAACDTEALVYLPLLEELGVMPRRKFATANEILAHCHLIARQFQLYRDTCFQTEVTRIAWDEAIGRWIITTNRQDAIRARFVVVSAGPMDRPKLAGIPGFDSFKGHAFHTSRWDYTYTGGNADGGLTGLGGKTVGIIGTGATAIQCIPHLAQSAKQLYAFQRTPSSVDIRADRELDPAWIAAIKPGWQQQRIENFTTIVSGGLPEEDLVDDGWTAMLHKFKDLVARAKTRGDERDPAALYQLADFLKMDEIRRRVDAAVSEQATADALKPWYDRFCKRPCFHDEYLASFNRPNVTLVDTQGQGVERITGRTVIAGGNSYPIDCLIYSTGFEASKPFARRISFSITGRGGVTLLNKWRDGAATQHGVLTHDFPNLFFMSHVQSGLSLNFTHMINEQARHIAYILGHSQQQSITQVEVSRAAEQAWVAEIDRTAASSLAFASECTPSYFNQEGDLSRMNARNSAYGGGPMAFYRIIADWRSQGNLAGLHLTRRPS